ncbi:MAG: hypothetical protein M1820_001506 [Bogoriella megaspora]|nr:MAG: hypothetical protein M1820_001506 [Bogoriella megaspora]
MAASYLAAPPSADRLDRAEAGSVTKQLTPEQYNNSIQEFAKRFPSKTLYPGLHFGKLTAFLQKPTIPETKRSLLSNYSPVFNFATLYTFSENGSVNVQKLNDTRELQQHTTAEEARMLFLCGQPCPQWLLEVGATYHIDPEFFQRHLDFLSAMGSRDYFVQPSLLSTSRYIIQLEYMSIGELPSQAREMSQGELDSLRASNKSDMLEYLATIDKNMTTKPPTFESIVRSCYLLDKSHFAIEQRISICFNQTSSSGWTVVVWIDTGKPLAPEQKGPWAEFLRANKVNGLETFLPWIPYHPNLALQSQSVSISHARRGPKDFEQSASLIHLDYGKTLDKHLMAQDPFYAIHELFVLCAFSKTQFLTALESKIAADAETVIDLGQNLSPSNMMYFQNLLDAQVDKLQENIKSIRSQEDMGWFRDTAAPQDAKCAAARVSLLKYYEGLLSHAKSLSKRCKARLNILMNRAAVVESNKAIEQAKAVTKLTRLAFFFTPLGFTSSFFGMNLGPFSASPSFGLWLFFAVSTPLVAILLILMTLDVSYLFGTIGVLQKQKKSKIGRVGSWFGFGRDLNSIDLSTISGQHLSS